ncbi:polyamine ABC transporter substrate-binding protein [Aquabacterium sp.]|uniref:polyamine ABC transporter substrate-binding protein n=1 Tax=Aquabacterium sp. TaxID=1872578 RepID=UPI004037A57E
MTARTTVKTFLNPLRAATLLALTAMGTAHAEEEKVLNVYNWSNYIAPDTVANFEKEYGIKVRYDVFDSNEIVHAKLVAGKTGYDIVVPSSYWAKMQADGGLLQKVDKSKLPNLKNIDPSILAQLARLDPGNQYMVNWMWGYTTVGINVDKVKAALGDLPMPDNTWDLVFKPEYISRLKSCGVSFLDSPTEVVPAALHYLGRPAYSKNIADYQAVPPLLKSIRPYVTLFSSTGYINDLANGSICAAFGYSGDINIAKSRALEGKTGQNIKTLTPKTGGVIFMDTMVIPADAPHPENAHLWMNYIMRPEVHAALTNKVFYANPNLAARKFVKPEIANDPAVFPPEPEMKKMAKPEALNNDIRRQMTRIYTSFKTGL